MTTFCVSFAVILACRGTLGSKLIFFPPVEKGFTSVLIFAKKTFDTMYISADINKI